MYKQHQINQWFCGLSSITCHHIPDWQKPHLSFLCAASAFLVLAAPTIVNLPGSKLLAQAPISQDLETASFYQQGVTRYNRGDWQGAENAFRQALQREPNLAMARKYLGNVFLMQNRLDVAVQEYGEAIRLNPNLGEAYYNLGLALQQQGKKAGAITAYRQALVIEPTRVESYYNLGLVLYEQGLIQEAIAAYQDAINLEPSKANAHHNLAIALQQVGKMEEAIVAYREVLKLDPTNATAYSNLGSLMAMQGQPAEAIAIYTQAVRQDPKNASAYYNLGITLYNQGDLQKASSAFKRAHEEYRQQGNFEQTAKSEQLLQQVAQKIEEQKQASTPKPTATSTNNLVEQLTQLAAPREKPANSGDVPISSEQQFQPVFPNPSPDKLDSNGKV
ncbi:tetratricopeptide repeat protein [Anabaena subtropica]|uniref:Tetratricopeptide repeat protein n=1 Tax=Anabaena subtropica FACHB-260 TaxID=2692884 RepID=A0ABR8CX82_9NOST|nr:tetratricopeptide repeat protein [Anabaena subtropica]MBD2347060.1 tetratricopeptide repeat protein [Anabaena subtropica FACHB-260]